MPNWEAPGNSNGTLPVYIEQAYTNNLGYDVAFMSGSEIVDSSPRFIGSTHPYSVVYAWDNGVVVGSTRAAADGSWSLSAQFADGPHSLTFGLNASAASLPLDFSVNSAAAIPVVVSQGYTDDLGYDVAIWGGSEIVDNTPRFEGTAAPEAIIYAWDAGKLIASTVSDSDGNWSIETRLQDGQHALTFGSSAEESTQPFTFSIDSNNAIPVTIGQGYEDNLGYDDAFMSGDQITDTTPRFVGTAAPEAIIYAWDYGVLLGSTVSELDGSWSFTLPELDLGAHAVTFGSEPEVTSNPMYFSVQSSEALPANISIAELLSQSETLLLSDSDIAPQTYSQPFSLTQQDLSVQSQNGITGISSAFTPELEEHFA